MFTINNNDIASNMLIVIVFYAISLSLMVNIKIYTYKSYLNDGPWNDDISLIVNVSVMNYFTSYKLNNTIAINKRNIIIIDGKDHTYTHM